MRWLIVTALAGCTHPTIAEQLKAACDTQECPEDPPEYVSCMPVISKDLEPVCTNPCRIWLANTCGIRFVE